MSKEHKQTSLIQARDTDLGKRNLVCLGELTDLLAAIDDATYCSISPLVDGSMGTHVRHLLEFYQIFLDEWDSGNVCYVHRERCMELQTSVDAAHTRALEICSNLQRVHVDMPLRVAHFGGAISQSCTTRELSYLLDHTVHHLALINVHARLADIPLPEQFGFSASTVAHQVAS
ncbi:MAG: hypothetical protein NXH85_02450 [Pseudomonadaceae bacterium]|nr:hypothetical protein [Pseudomonadaceae bacterium]